ncbi:MAG TPA: putative Ig domain-containing protein [Steroidobacteraceae bacterium]|nr:putative Ig domain-containing protein [Steroidobacteraceae bacterium]
MHSRPIGRLALVVAVLALAAFDAHANSPPQISGTPATVATVAEPYAFQPTASDPEGSRLRFKINGKPVWATFNSATGKLYGTPQSAHVGTYSNIRISVSDGRLTAALPAFSVTVAQPKPPPKKANYGHYFATRYADTPADAAMLCEQAGVRGVVWRTTWGEIERSAGEYDFSSFDAVLAALAGSHNPQCQLWLFIEYKSFASSPVKNPCPAYLQAAHSALNASGNGAATCFMWEPVVVSAYAAMLKAAAARYDGNARVEGLILQESALGFSGEYSQDVADGGTYTAAAWRDALVELVEQCAAAFPTSRCMSYLNFLRGGQQYLYDVSAAIASVPDNRACISGPDILPNAPNLYTGTAPIYEVIVRHAGCRSNSAQHASYDVEGCDLACIFQFGVGGTFGDFPEDAPLTGGLCINSYLFWTHRVSPTASGVDWTHALPIIAAYPYGPAWLDQCTGGGAPP